jgi:hypothetical protein
MANISTISIAMEADTSDWTDGLDKAIGQLEQFRRSVDQVQRSAGSFALPSFDATGGSSGAGDAAAAITRSLLPLEAIGSKIAAQVNAIGGTIVTLARRLDNAMKSPGLDKALDSIQTKLRDGIGKAAGTAVGDLTRVQQAVLKLGPAADKAVSGFRAFNKIKDAIGNFGDVAGKSLGQLGKVDLAKQVQGSSLLSRNFATVAPAVGKATAAVKHMGVQIGLALGAFALIYKGTSAITGFFASGIKGASDLSETVNKTTETFGASSAAVIGNADAMAKAYGIPKREILDASASIGLIAKGAGNSNAQAATLANTMSRLAADASSFYNVPMEAALEKIRSGLVGEAQPLRQFGVLLSEEAVKQEAVAQGWAKSKGKLDEQTKVMARASLIAKGLGTASGDLARTADSPANAMRRVSGQVENLATTVGELFLPAIAKATAVLSEMIGWASSAFTANKATFEGWAQALGSAIDTVGMAFRNLPLYAQIAWLKIQEGAFNVLAVVETLPVNLGLIADYIANNWKEIIVDAVNAVGAVFHNLGWNIGNLFVATQDFLAGKGWHFDWTPLLDGFEATAAKLPELLKPNLTSMQSEISKVSGQIVEEERRRAQAAAKGVAAAARPILPDFTPTGKGGGEDKYKGTAAVEMGSKEALSAIARFRNGDSGKDKAATDTAKNTADAAKGIRALVSQQAATKAAGSSSIPIAMASI